MNETSRIVILVADDEELVRNLVAVIVRSDGYQALIASNGAQALDLSRHYDGHIDLLISAVDMPGLIGIELANVLGQERPKTKVLLISSNRHVELPQRFAFLRKPFTVDALRQKIGVLLAPAE